MKNQKGGMVVATKNLKLTLLRRGALLAALLFGAFSIQAAAQEATVPSTPAEAPALAPTPEVPSAAPLSAAPEVPAKYIGEKACTNCHDVEKNNFGHTQHANVFHQNPRNEKEKSVCEACHGPGSKHAADTKDKTAIIGFSKEWGTPIDTQNGQCLSCHSGGQRMHWSGSIHQTNKMACSDCHNPMARFSANGLMKKASITETCETCHQQQRADFKKRSHMPVAEGKMTCVDCHNPHGTTTRPLLKADSPNELCYQCHAEKRGPFLWEHAPVRENCLNCHQAHGSNHEKLLNQTRPFLCDSCHSTTGTMGHAVWGTNTLADTASPTAAQNQHAVNGLYGTAPSKRMASRSCTNCHSTIHGSNSPLGARFQR